MVSISVKEFAQALQLKILTGQHRQLTFSVSDLNRPGLQLAGYMNHFPPERLQIIGSAETSFLQDMSAELQTQRISALMSLEFPCLVICRDLQIPLLLEIAEKFGKPVLSTPLQTTKFIHQAVVYLDKLVAPITNKHGVLVDVYGVGILLMGKAGIGKSETALELIKRGHRLVADDAVQIRKVSDSRLVGEAPALIRHFMEVRGVGLIDVKTMYGVSSVIANKSVDLVMQLEHWDEKKEYDRLGIEQQTMDILGVHVPMLTVPVAPGRNLAIIVEVAARNYRLRLMGENAAVELDRRLAERMHQSEEESGQQE